MGASLLAVAKSIYYAIIPFRMWWSAVRIATIEYKQIKTEERLSWKLSKGCRLSLIQFRSRACYIKKSELPIAPTSEFVER